MKNVITVEGSTNDLLNISKSGEMKQTRLFHLIPHLKWMMSFLLNMFLPNTQVRGN